jgi:pimeloyl-ACP methyl ester carboxylesterase
MSVKPLLLDPNGAKETAALHAEEALRAVYGLAATEHSICMERFGIHVRVVEYGNPGGAPLLVAPGNTGDSFVFLPLIARLTGRRVLALNRPGGGLSEGFDHRSVDYQELALTTMDAVLDYFALECVDVLAHSMGGHWSLWYAAQRPQRVQRLALLGVPGNVLRCKPPFALRLTSIPGLNRRLFARIVSRDAAYATRGLKFMGHAQTVIDALPPEMAECYFRFQNLPNYEISSLSLMEATNSLFFSKKSVKIGKRELRRVAQPVLLLWGENDPFGSVKAGRAVQSALPSAQFHVVPGGGHLPWFDAPAQCGDLVAEFFTLPKN